MAEGQSIGMNMPSLQMASRAVMRRSDIFFAVGIMGIIMVLLVPVPPPILDLLLALSITISVLILMTVLFIDKPLALSSFPTILLIATMLRLSLNITSVRLILSHGSQGTDAAGKIIQAFGALVMAGSVLIGGIVFAILTIINFVVITKGSGRIAEVSARFSLDAMPGKQMAIDADLSAGLIDEKAAKARRKELEDESTFYGSMDGASKFVRGDAIAGLLITFINFIGGIIIGTVQKNMSFSQALETYTVLTIGDGLVSQIPALIVSTAAGLLVTKAGISGSAEKAVLGQLGRSPTAIAITSGLLFFMAVMPGLPALPFLFLSSVTGYVSWKMFQRGKKDTDAVPGAPAKPGAPSVPGVPGAPADAKTAEEQLADSLHIDVLRLELGYGLLPLINYQKGHRLTEQIKALRKQMARDLGFVIPPVRIQDNMQLPPNTYVIKVKEVETGRGEVKADMLLVMNPSGAKIDLPGEDTTEPTFGLPAMWIADTFREEALFKNYTVVDPPYRRHDASDGSGKRQYAGNAVLCGDAETHRRVAQDAAEAGERGHSHANQYQRRTAGIAEPACRTCFHTRSAHHHRSDCRRLARHTERHAHHRACAYAPRPPNKLCHYGGRRLCSHRRAFTGMGADVQRSAFGYQRR